MLTNRRKDAWIAAVLVAPVAIAVLELLWFPAQVMGAGPWALHAMALAAFMVYISFVFG